MKHFTDFITGFYGEKIGVFSENIDLENNGRESIDCQGVKLLKINKIKSQKQINNNVQMCEIANSQQSLTHYHFLSLSSSQNEHLKSLE